MRNMAWLVMTLAIMSLAAGCSGDAGGTATAAKEEAAQEDAAQVVDTRVADTALTGDEPGEPARAMGAPAHGPVTPALAKSADGERVAPDRSAPDSHRAITIPAGTMLEIELASDVSSKTSTAGDVVRARVATAVSVDGGVAIPAGSTLSGTVEEANPADRFGGISSLALRFDTVECADGRTVPVQASFRTEVHGEKKKDAATIGGAAAGGALLGRILNDDDRAKGTKKGAIAGAVIGTAVAAATKGREVEMTAGTLIQVELVAPATF